MSIPPESLDVGKCYLLQTGHVRRVIRIMPSRDLSPQCQITGIHYAGDEGGIVCELDFKHEDGKRAIFVSITHLTFDRRLPLAPEIAADQKHRIKRISSSSTPPSGAYS